ncbi:hypothetical protein ZYGR_0AD06570 [Zygosaccharomyces rouxii]|uniref:ZYRO0G21186p n=2 Tax=Zygosaccharomyces rouxii TaxID=4956 RepID=C5E1I2_ZYGRC|nr:uncharacterized protein ZYRO0G21186g [Zygosaccharomyces rouxii]KAH9202956.1 hypothetical protein LQ764DRAFT_72928 [Zygosaccharomyces rouxii]GAV51474.1 hypothetical protein ZYGR_0AD06570 [Zygosaccharomyces rouxii]CAR29966.1 ZYRO0G21186p [Zygosaccharomyces rouxii]
MYPCGSISDTITHFLYYSLSLTSYVKGTVFVSRAPESIKTNVVADLTTFSLLSSFGTAPIARLNSTNPNYQAMSFFQKLISFKPNKKQGIQQQASEDANKCLYTRDEEDFVHIYPSLSCSNGVANEDEESVDISKWEMAEILNQGNKIVVTKNNNKTKEDTLERLRRYRDRPSSSTRATVTEDTRPCMEDSRELEMFDDKRNRVTKGSRRRKYL